MPFNSSLQLNCPLERGYPLPTDVTWWRGQSQLLTDDTSDGRIQINGHVLRIQRLTSVDAAIYSCTIRNDYEMVSSQKFSLVVASPCQLMEDCADCKYGYKRDENNCPTCSCVEPCAAVKCPEDHICQPACKPDSCLTFTTRCLPAKPKVPPSCEDSLKSRVCRLIVTRYNCKQYARKCCASCLKAGKVTLAELEQL